MKTNALSDRLQNCYGGIVFDVMREMGAEDCVLPNTLRPITTEQVVAGRVFTVEGSSKKGSLGEVESLTKWCEFLSAAPPDHVVICQPNDSDVSHMGELSSETLSYKGVRGYIVDGGCRDTGFIEKIGFSVWRRYDTPLDVVGTWSPDALGELIEIGGVVINTGDYVFADRDGVLIIPVDIVEAVIDRCEVLMKTENKVRTAILEGVDPVDAYNRWGKF